MCIVQHAVLFPMLSDRTQLKFLPSHVDALQRIAMTIEFAYGFKTIRRRGQDMPKGISLAPVTRSTTNVDVPTARNVPTPIIASVKEQLAMWISRRKSAPSKDVRIKNIQDDTEREIAKYPRKPAAQLEADLMRERLFNAYLQLHVGGWEDEMPPLILYYLVYTRADRLQRIANAPAPPAKRTQVNPGCKRCPQCLNVVRGCNTSTCPQCGRTFPGRTTPTVPKGYGNVRHCFDLYDQLPGRWEAQPWKNSDNTESIRVRNMGAEGMIGQYLEVLHEVGQRVKVRIHRRWRTAVVVQATHENYTVRVAIRGDKTTNVTVLRANVKDFGDETSSNSFFRIEKCPRSVVLVYGGCTKSFLHSYKGT